MIIEQHGGRLSAASDAHSGGSRFEVKLPANVVVRSGEKAALG
jgi:signal transduction histidine kinase